MHRRWFLASGLAAASCAQRGTTQDLTEVPLADLVEGLRAGRYTSQSLTAWYLERIAAVDRKGLRLGAVIETNGRAMEDAAARDGERKQNAVRSPLHGIPILLKDNIDTADAMTTTAGSFALEGWRPPKDAAVAAALRAAGAVLLGKANMSEWANFRSTRSVSGWSARGGQCRNPYALDRNPSGSSSGSAVAAAASLCAAAVGTETDGSITSPSAMCGLVGLKPTVGLLGSSGIIPISHVQDTAGPMARSVRDVALLLGGMGAKGDWLAGLQPGGLRGARIGIARKFWERHPFMNALLDAQVDVLKGSGAEVIDPADLPTFGNWGDHEMEALRYEFKANLNAYLATQPDSRPVRSLAQLIAFNEKQRERELSIFGQELLVQCEAKGPLTEKAYVDARRECRRLFRDEGLDAVFRKHKLDAMVTMTSAPAWFTDWVHGDVGGPDCTAPAAVAGYPHLTVPAGLYRGLPVGLSFFGTANSDAALLRLGYAYEQETKARRKPEYLTTLPTA